MLFTVSNTGLSNSTNFNAQFKSPLIIPPKSKVAMKSLDYTRNQILTTTTLMEIDFTIGYTNSSGNPAIRPYSIGFSNRDWVGLAGMISLADYVQSSINNVFNNSRYDKSISCNVTFDSNTYTFEFTFSISSSGPRLSVSVEFVDCSQIFGMDENATYSKAPFDNPYNFGSAESVASNTNSILLETPNLGIKTFYGTTGEISLLSVIHDAFKSGENSNHFEPHNLNWISLHNDHSITLNNFQVAFRKLDGEIIPSNYLVGDVILSILIEKDENTWN